MSANVDPVSRIKHNQIVTGLAKILAGQAAFTIPIAPPYATNAYTPPVLVALNGIDATLTTIVGVLSANGLTLTVTGNANATGNVTVSYLIDFRQ